MPDGTTVLLELCQRATNLANTNSTRTVEYMTASKGHQTPGFRDLAINYLEVCQTLWPLQAGLLDPARTTGSLPTDVAKELSEKVQQTIDDFNALDMLLTRLLTYERKKGFSRFTKGLGMMNIDSEVLRLSNSLAKDRDTLRMGSLAFKWLLGDATLPSTMNSAYTSLVTVLRGGKGPKPASLQPQQSIASLKQAQSLAVTQENLPFSQRDTTKASSPPTELPPLPNWRDSDLQSVVFERPTKPSNVMSTSGTSPSAETMSTLPKRSRLTELPSDNLRLSSPAPPNRRYLSTPHSEKHSSVAAVQEVDDFSVESRRQTMSDTASQTTVESIMQLEDMLKSYEYERRGPVIKSQALPKSHIIKPLGQTQIVQTPSVRSHPSSHPPRRNPQNAPRATSPTVRAAIVTAIQQKNHQGVEELLETSVSLDALAELDLLHLAISLADCSSVRLLLLSGAEPNEPCRDGSYPLQLATQMGFSDVAGILLKYRADPNLSSATHNQSAVLIAIATNQVELLDLFDRHSTLDFNLLSEDGDTLFIKAITTTSSLDMVMFMLERGADPNKKTKFGKTPLLESLFSSRLDIATALLEAGANSNLAGPKHPLWPAVHEPALLQLLLDHGSKSKMAPGIMELATSINSIEAVSILLEAKVDPNIKKDGVYTPLCSAIRDDRADIVALLLRNNASPNVPASEYPAFKCVTHDRLQYLPDLIAAGADLNSPKGILEVAVAHNNKQALMFLLSQGVDANARDSEGHTALTTAIRNDQIDLIDILLEKGASPAIRGSGQNWPLTLAIQNPIVLAKILHALPKDHHGGTKGIVEAAVVANQLESVKLLIAAGFSVEDKTGGVFSPLTSALRERHLDIVRLLLDEAGADINAAGEHLPIVKALRRCRGPEDTEAIEMLLERGADINLVYRGWSGIMQAIEGGDSEILKLMIDKAKMAVDLSREYEEGQTLVDFIHERDWEEGEELLLKRNN